MTMPPIELPADIAPPRRRNPAPAATTDAAQQTLATYEALAIGTSEWNGTDAPEFSDDGVNWSTAWAPTGRADEDGDEHPTFARATVYRKGVKRPVVVIIRWDEAVPADDEWRTLWLRKPITLFGSFALRAALRRAFRDTIGDQYGPDEHHDQPAEVTA